MAYNLPKYIEFPQAFFFSLIDDVRKLNPNSVSWRQHTYAFLTADVLLLEKSVWQTVRLFVSFEEK